MGRRFNVAGRLLATGLLIALAACGGGGNDGGGGGTSVTISGKVTFDRVPVGSNGLNFNAVSQDPARQVLVEAIHASTGAIIEDTTTDASGNYSLSVPANTSMFVRVKAQMQNFRVLNNTNGNALYALDGSQFNSGTSNSTRNLHAPSGWNGTSYAGTRAAAPFAILDTMYRARQLLTSAQSSLSFPALDLFWSATNRSSDTFCPSAGDIGTTSFVTVASGDTDDCTPAQATRPGIYVLGAIADTDEFDQHVMAHEFGHYVETSFSRSDSIGGSHSFGEALDLRVAFGEGFGNAFSGMVLNDALYRDSFGTTQVGGFDLDNNAQSIPGWYSEAAIGQILWDLFDAGVEPSIDNVQIPFATLFSVLANGQRTTPALTSIFSFVDALRDADPANIPAIDLLMDWESVNGVDEFGAGEFDFNGSATQPVAVYIPIAPGGGAVPVCTNAVEGVYNKLHNRRFLRMDLAAAGTHSIVVSGAGVLGGTASTNPQVILWRQGDVLAFGNSTGATETLSARQFAAGTYIIEVFDANYGSISGTGSAQQRCMTVTVN